jgi:hypothetical protein
VTPEGKEVFRAPAPPAAPPAPSEITKLISERNQFPAGSAEYNTINQRIKKLTEKTLAQPAAPVAVLGPDGKPVLVPRDQAIGMTPASAATTTPSLTPVQQQKRRDSVGKAFASANNTLQVMQDVLDSADAVKKSPGLGRATGYSGVYLPSITGGEAAKAEVRLANLKGKITALGKAAAAATGSIGSIANQEWKILSDQIAVVDPVKGEAPLREQIGLIEAQARGAMNRIRDEYERIHGEDFELFPQFRELRAPSFAKDGVPTGRQAPASGGSVDMNNPLLR